MSITERNHKMSIIFDRLNLNYCLGQCNCWSQKMLAAVILSACCCPFPWWEMACGQERCRFGVGEKSCIGVLPYTIQTGDIFVSTVKNKEIRVVTPLWHFIELSTGDKKEKRIDSKMSFSHLNWCNIFWKKCSLKQYSAFMEYILFLSHRFL